jgi:hypothetical protein
MILMVIRGRLKKMPDKILEKFSSIPNGTADVGTLDLGGGIVISEGRLKVDSSAGKKIRRLSGNMRLCESDGFEAGGFLDANIVVHARDPDTWYIGTLVRNSFLNIGPTLRLTGGTIRFEYCSRTHAPGAPLPYAIDEMDELLFQTTDPVALGAFPVVGVGTEPVTVSMTVNALSPENIRACISLFPARIRIPDFGQNTCVFLSGEAAHNAVEIDVRNKWSAFVSTSPYVHLIDHHDPAGPSLIEGSGLFTGKLEGRGVSRASLSISTPLNDARAFPQSEWPQKLPSQNITFSVSESGAAHLDIFFNPLRVDGFLICSAEAEGMDLTGSLTGNVLSFKGEFLVTREGSNTPPRPLAAFAIDKLCRVWIDGAGKKTELQNWF